jgi:hypothetical protein
MIRVPLWTPCTLPARRPLGLVRVSDDPVRRLISYGYLAHRQTGGGLAIMGPGSSRRVTPRGLSMRSRTRSKKCWEKFG